ncbi:MAG: hypothetical protein ACFFA3_04225 [Promethearchaeota archaeon]
MLKQREWLIQDEKMIDKSPKEYYKQMFKELIHEIMENNERLIK